MLILAEKPEEIIMPFDGNDLVDDALPQGRGALRIGLLLTLLGAAILIGPLFYAIWSDPNGESSGALIIGLPLFVFIASLFLAFGLTVLFSQVVDYRAVGAGKVRILGLEMPMEFQGAAMVLFLLLLGIGTSIKLFDLMSINANWSQWADLRETVDEQKEKISKHEGIMQRLKNDHLSEMGDQREALRGEMGELQARVADMKGRLEASHEGVKTLREVLIAQTNTSVHRLMIRFKCSQYEDPRLVNWSGSGNARTGNLLTHPWQSAGENSTELPSQTLNPFTLKAGNETTYTIMSVEDLTSLRTPVISASFHFEQENLVATIWPNTMSLLDLCKRQYQHRSSVIDPDGQAPVSEARTWQDEVEREGDGL
ncbi:hypothetical protein KL867_05200 [Ruegeria litorea]|uniref:Uncharacterized protein n=1 Tax=Falsiruegeria litorea TaxID=1280831 RepID=A0ABS5WMS9_9RHOB|nr:hypothetical protein [Falsiruegeria litorea]MBT3140436.1 hypothetical protein [Falsiruegeria litorea]